MNVMPSNSPTRETLIYSNYYAPRGRQRLYLLAQELSVRYIHPLDLLVGVIGTEGAGKSTLIKGLFPGLELTNDDEGVNRRPAPLFEFDSNDFFSGHTFHIDVRYESAFKQKYEIVQAVNTALEHGRRVVVEHFDQIYDELGYNAHILFGIGEEIIVSRPTIFGPPPGTIHNVVSRTIKFRLMAHSAEDLTSHILKQDYGWTRDVLHSDVRHGFVIAFPEKPEINIRELELKVLNLIKKDLPIRSSSEGHIAIGDNEIFCTGVRTHVRSTGQIENFRLLPEYRYDQLARGYMLIGMVGNREVAGFEEIVPLIG